MGEGPISRRAVTAGLAATLGFGPVAATAATPEVFDARWQHLTFRRIPPTGFRPDGTRLIVRSERGASVFWRVLAEGERGLLRASWRWSVAHSVPATDLARRGGDDRNLALYWVFLDPRAAERVGADADIADLLGRRGARIVIHVWGGDAPRGTVSANPWFRGRGANLALREAGTGDHAETVDLAADHQRAFGEAPGVPVGLAVSADGDDTASDIEAVLEDLRLG
jgi:hypothetical protein